MEPASMSGASADDEVQRQILAMNGEVSFLRRARAVEDALNALLKVCRKQRDEMLGMVRTRLAVLHALTGDWSRLTPFLADPTQTAVVEQIHTHLAPHLRSVMQRTESEHEIHEALLLLVESLERFNRRWRERVENLQLDRLNQLREEYNRYYPLEKEFATRTNASIVRRGFTELAPVTPSNILEWLPLLPVPSLRS